MYEFLKFNKRVVSYRELVAIGGLRTDYDLLLETDMLLVGLSSFYLQFSVIPLNFHNPLRSICKNFNQVLCSLINISGFFFKNIIAYFFVYIIMHILILSCVRSSIMSIFSFSFFIFFCVLNILRIEINTC